MVVIFKYLEDTIDTMGCGCGDACELNTDGLFTVKKTKKTICSIRILVYCR